MKEGATVEMAKQFAISMHGEQKYGKLPYSHHLAATVSIGEEYGIKDPDVVAALWLHDVIEDTDCTTDMLTDMFGPRVAAIVWSVTDAPDEPGKPPMTRKERKQKTYLKTRYNKDGVLVKLCDRLANIRQCLWNGDKEKFQMYLRENAEFLQRLGMTGTISYFPQKFVMLDILKAIDTGKYKFSIYEKDSVC